MFRFGNFVARTARLGALAVILGWLVGCVPLANLLVGPAEEPGAPPAPPTVFEKGAEAASGIPGPIGVAGGIALALLNLLQVYQNRQGKAKLAVVEAGFKGAVVGIDRALEQGQKEAVSKEELYAQLILQFGSPILKEMIAKFKAEERS